MRYKCYMVFRNSPFACVAIEISPEDAFTNKSYMSDLKKIQRTCMYIACFK